MSDEHSVQNESDERRTLLDALREHVPQASMTTLRRMIGEQRVTVDGRPAASLKQAVRLDAEVKIRPSRKTLHKKALKKTLPPAAKLNPLKIVFEDADVLIVFKPADLLTSTVAREKRATALAIVREYLSATDPSARVGLIHRLDRDASGLLVFSKNHEAYESLKSQFFHHTVDREYQAIVRGRVKPRAGRIESRLVERADGSVHSARQPDSGQVAITDYEVIQSNAKRGSHPLTALRVRLQTGRKHQIRVQLSEKGWPIVGDKVYGGGRGKLQLRAISLGFDHPRSGERVTFSAPGLLLDGLG